MGATAARIGTRRRLLACGAVVVGLLAAPPGAVAATKTVFMGPPGSSGYMDPKTGKWFYHYVVDVRVGDSLRFVANSPHNVELPEAGEAPRPAFVPRGGTASGVDDEAGAPFWFNGRPVLGLDPVLERPRFGETVAYDGTRSVNSGLPADDDPEPFTVRFTRTGVFRFFCTIHPGMKGKVAVKPRRADVRSRREYTADLRAELRVISRIAKGLVRRADRADEAARSAPLPDDTVLVGFSRRGIDLHRMVPASATVPVGTTVTFRMRRSTRNFHSVTFGPGDPEREPTSYLGALAASLRGSIFDPRATYPSEPPGTVATLTPALHGNGFWNSGIMSGVSGDPYPSTAKVTFGQPGTYRYLCLRHPDMAGTVTVG